MRHTRGELPHGGQPVLSPNLLPALPQRFFRLPAFGDFGLKGLVSLREFPAVRPGIPVQPGVLQGNGHQVQQGAHGLNPAEHALPVFYPAGRGQHRQHLVILFDGDEVGDLLPYLRIPVHTPIQTAGIPFIDDPHLPGSGHLCGDVAVVQVVAVSDDRVHPHQVAAERAGFRVPGQHGIFVLHAERAHDLHAVRSIVHQRNHNAAEDAGLHDLPHQVVQDFVQVQRRQHRAADLGKRGQQPVLFRQRIIHGFQFRRPFLHPLFQFIVRFLQRRLRPLTLTDVANKALEDLPTGVLDGPGADLHRDLRAVFAPVRMFEDDAAGFLKLVDNGFIPGRCHRRIDVVKAQFKEFLPGVAQPPGRILVGIQEATGCGVHDQDRIVGKLE